MVGGPGITKRGHTVARTKDDLSRMPDGSRVTPHNVMSFRHDTHVKRVYGKLDMHQRETGNRA